VRRAIVEGELVDVVESYIAPRLPPMLAGSFTLSMHCSLTVFRTNLYISGEELLVAKHMDLVTTVTI
jgi:hypothetical protein